MDFVADFSGPRLIHGEGVIIESELVSFVVFVEVFKFVDNIFGCPHTIFSAEHSDCSAEITPKHASAACHDGIGMVRIFELTQFFPKVKGGKW